MISYEMIEEAYQNQIIHLEPTKSLDGIVCRIGNFTFPFGGVAAMNAKNIAHYRSILTEQEIVGAIYDKLESLLEEDDDFLDEYRYCECFLRSQGLGMNQSQAFYK